MGDFKKNLPPKNTSFIIADPIYGTNQKNEILMNVDASLPLIIFMYAEEIYDLKDKPDQVLFWVKPVSTKNTKRNYSRFVEVMAVWNLEFHQKLHWSNRTGIFTDVLIENESHPFKKPPSLIERLILNHYPGEGIIYDPCAGSGTVHDLCIKLGIPSVSVEIDPKYERR